MNSYYSEKGITLFQADCLEAMRLIPDASIDACITDPPYGTTACSWDSVIPFAPMWAELKRIVKKNGAIVLFGSQPFTSALVMSNPQMFKYEWVWNKVNVTGFLDVKRRPMKKHENVLVFSQDSVTYNPQKSGDAKRSFGKLRSAGSLDIYSGAFGGEYDQGVGYPQSIIEFQRPTNITDREFGLHATQKPLDLMRYLVRTYTNEGDTVLDFTCGSGTTGVACVIERREFIGVEQDAHYSEVSAARIKRAQGVACDIPKRVKQYAPTPLFEAVA